jgi:hypothetical protein
MKQPHTLIGSWVNGDEYKTEVEYIISGKEPRFKVRVVDRYDGEKGEVHDISYDDKTSTLSFSIYWNSTGRFVKTRMHAISQNRVSYTYTFTESQMWLRKGTESDDSPPHTASSRKRKPSSSRPRGL